MTFSTPHSPQNAEAHFSILVQVRVEPHPPPSSGYKPYSRGVVWVVRREAKDEMEEPSFVRRVKGSSDENMQLLR